MAAKLEIHALNNAFYDLERFGLRFVASPRHADVLLVTGPVTRNMREALAAHLRRDARPEMGRRRRRLRARRRHLSGSYAVVGGVSAVVPGRSPHPGLPPRPTQLLKGLLSLLEAS